MPINFPGVPTRAGTTGQVWTRDSLHDEYEWTVPSGGGTGAPSYVHNQGVTSSVWIITHNLGYYPNVMVFDSANTEVEGDVTQTSSNIMTITFSAAFTGTAYLSEGTLMARKFLTHVDLNKNELQNAAVQNLATAPATPVKGQLYYNSTGGDDTLYWWNGTVWVPAKAGAALTPAASVTTSAVGDAATVGSSLNYARQDHAHGREAFGNVTAETTFGTSSANGVATTLPRSDHAHGNPAHNAAAHSAISISSLAAPTADVPWGSFKITSLADPISNTDAATKQYVDNLTAGLAWKDPVRIASTANLGLSGLAAIDGVTPSANDRVLAKNQTTPSQNGIYVAAAGAWTRTTDADTGPELEQAAVFVMEGTTLGDSLWVNTTNAPITVGTTSLSFTQFGGGGGPPTGAAGGSLAGSYPNPTLASNSVAAAQITDGTVTNAELAVMNANSIKGNNTGGANVALDLTGTQTTALLDVFTSTLKGLSPASGGGTANFLRADGTYAVPPGATNGTVRKFTLATVGGATSQVVNHALATTSVSVTVFNNSSPFDEILCDVQHTDANNVTLLFTVAPATNAYTCVVMG